MNGGYLTKRTSDLLNDFGAGGAAPGSGSAAALMGLLAAKLLVTVCKKSLEKDECKKDRKVFEHILEQIERQHEPDLRRLFEADASEFQNVVDLRQQRNLSEDAEEKRRLAKSANELLETTTDNVFEIIDICMKLVEHGITVFDAGWKHVRGDSGAAIGAAIAGVMSGIFVVNLNFRTLKARKYCRDNVGRCDLLYKELQAKQERAFNCVVQLNTEAIDAVQLDLVEEAID